MMMGKKKRKAAVKAGVKIDSLHATLVEHGGAEIQIPLRLLHEFWGATPVNDAPPWVNEYLVWLSAEVDAIEAEAAPTGILEFYRDASAAREHRWRLKSANGRILTEPEGFTRIAGSEGNAERVRAAMVAPKVVYSDDYPGRGSAL